MNLAEAIRLFLQCRTCSLISQFHILRDKCTQTISTPYIKHFADSKIKQNSLEFQSSNKYNKLNYLTFQGSKGILPCLNNFYC